MVAVEAWATLGAHGGGVEVGWCLDGATQWLWEVVLGFGGGDLEPRRGSVQVVEEEELGWVMMGAVVRGWWGFGGVL